MPPETCWGSVEACILDTGFAVGLRTPNNQFAFRLRFLVPAPVKPAPSGLRRYERQSPRVAAARQPWAM